MKRIILIFGLIALFFIVTGCNTVDTSSNASDAPSQEEKIELTPEEIGEIAEAEDYCNALDSLDAFDSMDDWNECVYDQLSWSTGSRYKKYKAQQEQQMSEEGLIAKDESGSLEWT